jgi:hypothetical protein
MNGIAFIQNKTPNALKQGSTHMSCEFTEIWNNNQWKPEIAHWFHQFLYQAVSLLTFKA